MAEANLSEHLTANDSFDLVEKAFQDALDVSLDPVGPDDLYGIIAALNLPQAALVVDVGCGEGDHSRRLAERYGLKVHGIDPVPRLVATAELDATGSSARSALRFSVGTAEEVPADADSVDLVWCRDVLVLVPNLDRAYAEFNRILRPGGYALIYTMLSTTGLTDSETRTALEPLGVVPPSATQERTEQAITSAGLRTLQSIDLGSQWGEYAEEHTGKGGRKLLHAARLLRSPDQYIATFGHFAYEVMLADCLWHVFRMIGKLRGAVYLLQKPLSPDS